MEVDENNFIKSMKKKNTKAIDFVVDSYGNLVFKVVHSVLNSSFHSQYTEECVNDVFLSVWNNIESFDEEKGNFKYWITAIAKYKAIDYKRKLFKQSNTECLDDYTFSADVNTENILISKENKEEVLKIINEISTKNNETIVKYTAEGKAPATQSSELFIKDAKGERINVKNPTLREDNEKPNEFTMVFEGLYPKEKYSIGTTDFSNYELREDLRFNIQLDK